jgi:predicted SnoaL-like aldol condensation-catalyzing enzyme
MTLSKTLELALLAALFAAGAARAQVPVVPAANQEALLASADPKLAANKKLVWDFWREVLEAGHMDQAERLMAEGYVQHNPNVPTGRAAFVAFFTQHVKPKPVQPRIAAPLVSIVAEGDLVILSFVQPTADPKDATKMATTTWFDMFRIENGRIAEHWDCAPRQ